MNNSTNLQKLVISAFLFALGIVLPFVTGQIPNIGSALLPMHLPVLICGLVCGPFYGVIVGFTLPIFRSLIFGMPPLFPVAIAMSFELATYGLVTGYLYYISKYKCVLAVYKALIPAMVIGRVVWGIAIFVLLGINGKAFTFNTFLAGAFANAVIGIILQIILIPTIMLALGRAKMIPFGEKNKDLANG